MWARVKPTFNPGTSLRVQGQPELHNEHLSPKNKIKSILSGSGEGEALWKSDAVWKLVTTQLLEVCMCSYMAVDTNLLVLTQNLKILPLEKY